MSAPPADLQALLARIALGDTQAFERLYRATSAHLLGVAYGVLGERERAEDVLQEAYFNVWHAAGSYQAALAKPMTWLINIVRNKAIDRVRAGAALRSAQVPLHDEAGAEALRLPDDAEHQPQRLVEAAFVRARIDGCMSALASLPLADTSERLFFHVERLSVSFEPARPPPAAPRGEVVIARPCPKLW